jgi:hypothetical protein
MDITASFNNPDCKLVTYRGNAVVNSQPLIGVVRQLRRAPNPDGTEGGIGIQVLRQRLPNGHSRYLRVEKAEMGTDRVTTVDLIEVTNANGTAATGRRFQLEMGATKSPRTGLWASTLYEFFRSENPASTETVRGAHKFGPNSRLECKYNLAG